MTPAQSRWWARQRRRLARALTAAVTGRLVAGMPKTGLESIEKFLWHPDVRRHVAGIERMREASIISYPFPALYPEYFRRQHTFPQRNLFVLENVIVSPYSGLVWTPTAIFNESVGSAKRIMEWGIALDDLLLPVRVEKDERLVIACPPFGFYHWLLETLPNIVSALLRWPDLVFLMPFNPPSYVTESLALLLREKDISHRVLVADRPLKVPRLVMPEIYSEGGFVHPKDLEQLRRAFLPHANGASIDRGNATYEQLYVSRRRAPIRAMEGEELLETVLKARGFYIYYAEAHRMVDQIAAFSQARCIVAPHGAGLSNLVWADNPCHVVEIFRPDYFNDPFANICAVKGFRYDYLFTNCNAPHVDQTVVDQVLEKIECRDANAHGGAGR